MYIDADIPGEQEEMERLRPLIDAAVEKRNRVSERVPRNRQTTSPDNWAAPADDADPEWAEAQREVLRLLDLKEAAQQSYFRLNIWGMGTYRDLMEEVGMGYWPDYQPDWPQDDAVPYEVLQAYRAEQGDDEEDPDSTVVLTDELRSRAARLLEASDEVRAYRQPDRTGINLVKFTSNDGWRVTPQECREALSEFVNFLKGLSPTAPDTWQDYLLLTQDERKTLLASFTGTRTIRNYGNGPDEEEPWSDTLASEYFGHWLAFLDRASNYNGFEVW